MLNGWSETHFQHAVCGQMAWMFDSLYSRVRYYHGWVKYYHGLRTMVLFMKQLDDSTGGRVAERKNQGQKSLALANMVKGVNFNCELISSL